MRKNVLMIAMALLFLGTVLVCGWILLAWIPTDKLRVPAYGQRVFKTKAVILERTPITDLIQKIHNEKNAQSKEQLLHQLFEAIPTSDVDFQAIMQGDADVQWTGLATISNVAHFMPGLVKLVDDYPRNADLVERVAETISALENKEDVPALMDLVLRREASPVAGDQRLAEAALFALDEIRDPRVIEPFLHRKISTRHDNQIRKIALDTLYEMKRLISSIIEMAENKQGDEELLRAVVSSLENVMDERDIPALSDVVEKRAGSKKNFDQRMVVAAASALSNIKNQLVIEWVSKNEDLFFDRIGADVFGKFGVKVLPRLVEIAQNQNGERSKSAMHAIANMNDPAAAPMLAQLVTKEQFSPAVKTHAIRALSSLEGKGVELLDIACLEAAAPNVGGELALLFIRVGSPMQKEKVLAKFCAPGPAGSDWFIKAKMPELLAECIDTLRDNKSYGYAALIEKFLFYGDADVKISAAQYLAGADYERYCPQILKLLKYSNPKLNTAVLGIVTEKKELQAVAYAKILLKDPDDETRIAAARFLEVVTGKDESVSGDTR